MSWQRLREGMGMHLFSLQVMSDECLVISKVNIFTILFWFCQTFVGFHIWPEIAFNAWSWGVSSTPLKKPPLSPINAKMQIQRAFVCKGYHPGLCFFIWFGCHQGLIVIGLPLLSDYVFC